MEKVNNVEEYFEEYYDSSDRVVYFSKKTFRHEEEGHLYHFSYKYAIVVTDVSAFTGEGDTPIVVKLMLVPSFSDLTKENKEELIESGGYSGNEISEEGL